MNESLKNAYIQEVIKYLPQTLREDIKNELNANIDDQIENENLSLEDVLLDLGHPRLLAYSYLDEKENVIGPRYKESYYNILKLLIPLVWTIIIVTHLISLLFTGDFNFDDMFSSVTQSTFVVFTYVTVSFIIAEKVNKGENVKDDWSPKDINIKKYSHKTWSRSSSYVGIIFSLIFLVMINRFPELIGINIIGENTNIPFLDLANFDTFKLWFNIALIISVTRLFLRIFFVEYTKTTSLVSVGLNLISLIIVLSIMFNPNLLNPNLSSELSNLGFPEMFSFDFVHNLFRLSGLIILLIFGFDSYKELKYGLTQ